MEKVFENIEAYLDDSLNETERLAFEKELDNNPDLAAAMDRHFMAHDAIELLIADNLRTELKEMAAESKIKPIAAKRSSIRRYLAPLAIAASVALMVGVFGFLQKGNYSNESILARHYTAYEMPTVRSGSNNQALAEGAQAFQAKDLDKAITYFSNIPIENPLYTKAQFYLGQTYYQNGQADKAIASFDTVAQSDDLELNEKADWYALLASLAAQQEESNSFQNRIQRIAKDTGHSYHEQAKAIQADLDSFWR